MIVFDLDGTLADCEHRRHFVDPSKNHNYEKLKYYSEGDLHDAGWFHKYKTTGSTPPERMRFKPDWKAFYEACDQDKPIELIIEIFRMFLFHGRTIQIWSGRCESVRQKTLEWLQSNLIGFCDSQLKMRPISDSTPDDQLKERWLDEALAEGKTIEGVFDDRPKVIRMWRRRGIFVFNCCQHDEEF